MKIPVYMVIIDSFIKIAALIHNIIYSLYHKICYNAINLLKFSFKKSKL